MVCLQHLAAMPSHQTTLSIGTAVIVVKVYGRLRMSIKDDWISVYLCLHTLQPGQEGPIVWFDLPLVNRKDPGRSFRKGKSKPSVNDALP